MATAQGKRIVVMGAGIIGASMAYHLARTGAKVTVVDADGSRQARRAARSPGSIPPPPKPTPSPPARRGHRGVPATRSRVAGLGGAMDSVVIAAGTDITQLTDSLGIALPIAASPAILIRSKAQPDLVRSLISSPVMEVRHTADGALLAAEDYLDDTVDNQPAAIALRTAKAIRHELHGVVSIEPFTSKPIGYSPNKALNMPRGLRPRRRPGCSTAMPGATARACPSAHRCTAPAACS